MCTAAHFFVALKFEHFVLAWFWFLFLVVVVRSSAVGCLSPSFRAAVCHELRNPLHVLKTAAQLLMFLAQEHRVPALQTAGPAVQGDACARLEAATSTLLSGLQSAAHVLLPLLLCASPLTLTHYFSLPLTSSFPTIIFALPSSAFLFPSLPI